MQARQDTRFNSMLHECYGGRKAIRVFLATGRLQNIRVPPLDFCSVESGQRRPEPKPRTKPNADEHKRKYFARLAEDMRQRSREQSNRSTKLWDEFAPQVRGGRPCESKRFSMAAAWLRSEQERVEPGVSAGSGAQGASWSGASSSYREWQGDNPSSSREGPWQQGTWWSGRRW